MKRVAVEGAVYSQQTQFEFRPDPPSPFSASRLPQSVVEGRGGREHFAMNQHSQLQFNLGVPANSRNLATHFALAPSPVVVEKVAPTVTAVGLSQTPAHAFQAVSADRLALAIQLAKRNLRRGAASQSTPQPVQPSPKPAAAAPKQDNERHESVVPEAEKDLDIKAVDTAKNGKENTRKQVVSKAESRGNLKKKAAPDPSIREVARLRKELEQQVQKLKLLSERRQALFVAREDPGRRKLRRPLGSGAGRVWWEPEEGEEEREQRRRDEQAARNSRMLYNLQQQLSRLQSDVERIQKSDNKSTKKSQASHRLAAAHRAALRALQSYMNASPSPQPVPAELAILIQQLSFISSQLVGPPDSSGEGNRELDLALKQLKELVELEHRTKVCDRSEPGQLLKDKGTIGTRKSVKKVPKKKQSSVLFGLNVKSQRREGGRNAHRRAHFAQETHSSCMKRQLALKKLHSPSHSTPLQEPTKYDHGASPINRHHTRTPSPLHKHYNRKPSPHHRHHTLTPSPAHSPPSQKQVEKLDDAQLANDAWVGTSLARQAEELEQLRNETKNQLEELKSQLQSRHTLLPEKTAKVATHQPFNEEDKKDSPGNSQVDTSEGHPKQQQQQQQQTVVSMELAAMLCRLEEMEAEEEVIRQRWHSIAYEDPLTFSQPAVQLLETANGKADAKQEPTPSLKQEELASVEQYRERFAHYLKTTGLSTSGDFDPWRLVESLAEELLDEVIESVASEVGGVCDSLMENMYSDEFTFAS